MELVFGPLLCKIKSTYPLVQSKIEGTSCVILILELIFDKFGFVVACMVL